MNGKLDKYLFRNIHLEETEQVVKIEKICFPPNEACSEKHMKERIEKAPELFLVAVDKVTGRIAGFLNGLSTDEASFRDEFFTDAELYDPDGRNVMLLGLDVPSIGARGLQGRWYLNTARENGKREGMNWCLPVWSQR